MPQAPDLRPLPFLGCYLGRSRVMVCVACPRCGEVRERTASETRRELARPNFKGLCRPCSFKCVRDGTHLWRNHRHNDGRKRLAASGYVLIRVGEVDSTDLQLYRAMQTNGQPVFEHRLVMARHLGRPLKSDELVDHKNGHKTDNRIENLRLYIRGRQQPGSAPGHGTYYDEWQRAESRILKLEQELERLRPESQRSNALARSRRAR